MPNLLGRRACGAFHGTLDAIVGRCFLRSIDFAWDILARLARFRRLDLNMFIVRIYITLFVMIFFGSF